MIRTGLNKTCTLGLTTQCVHFQLRFFSLVRMTISTRIRRELFTSCEPVSTSIETTVIDPQVIRLPLTRPRDTFEPPIVQQHAPTVNISKREHVAVVHDMNSDQWHRHGMPWTPQEHDRFLKGLELNPCGPWKAIASYVGTRTPRQTMTHAQKYRQKIQRRRRGLKILSRQGEVGLHEGGQPAARVTDRRGPTTIVPADTEVTEHPSPPSLERLELRELDAALLAFLALNDYSDLFPMDQEDKTPDSRVHCDVATIHVAHWSCKSG
ncbi:hypothetical protein PsorP6_002949 [Peronosclerospora sorghi]|uniref:Uncharacterized protein n=1 Tax=Peronosclerospora sorghi TaxID=230839 RepID=A0ACC0VN99_9STRA|nr:hypothetical protein PsorP6_002949 [Peronosclerospora sorghi]